MTTELPKLTGDQDVVVSGDTFKHKDAIKAAGGRFSGGVWVFSGKGAAARAAKVAGLPGVSVSGVADANRAAVADKFGQFTAGKYAHPDDRAALDALLAVDQAVAWVGPRLGDEDPRNVLAAIRGEANKFGSGGLLSQMQKSPFEPLPYILNAARKRYEAAKGGAL